MNNVPKRYNTFTCINGILYDKVKEIAYKKGELMGNLGTFVNETKREPNIFFDDIYIQESGVYIYQGYNNPNIAYRIYKSFADYGFNGNRDDILIQELSKRKDNIKLTEFPSGVVTLEGKIIGQEIPYYPNYLSIYEYIKSNNNIDLNTIYKMILNIIKELYDNGILYYDTHAKNFLIKDNNSNIKINLIDFDYDLILFDNKDPDKLKTLLKNYTNLVNSVYRLSKKTHNNIFEETNTFEETYDQLHKLSKKLAS